ncbi:MAG: VPLPA-CTERM sorting domain-containing protein [Gammaproteobacteria bacterium]|nr:VPLPA-CTERM sorting domain-containing protein [Gammaproteobacteria bacterium]
MKKLLVALLGVLAVSGAFASTTGGPEGDPAPWANTLFVRGVFNGWDTSNPMSWDGSTYTAKVFIDVGDWEFKIANKTWDGPDFGNIGDPNVVLGTPLGIGTASFGNLLLSITEANEYLFTLSDIASDLSAGTLTVTKNGVVPIPAAGLLLLSALGGLGFLRRRS